MNSIASALRALPAVQQHIAGQLRAGRLNLAKSVNATSPATAARFAKLATQQLNIGGVDLATVANMATKARTIPTDACLSAKIAAAVAGDAGANKWLAEMTNRNPGLKRRVGAVLENRYVVTSAGKGQAIVNKLDLPKGADSGLVVLG